MKLSYDRFSVNAPGIPRVVTDLSDVKAALTPAGRSIALKDQLPEVDKRTRVSTHQAASFANIFLLWPG